MRVGRLLRHHAEIELCLEQEGIEELNLKGPLTGAVAIGDRSADRAYAIADDGRVEMIQAPPARRSLYELLPEDTDAVVVIEDGAAALYTAAMTAAMMHGLI